MEYQSLWEETDDGDGEGFREHPSAFMPVENLPCPPAGEESNAPSAKEESRLFDLIGKIDLKILQGGCVYIQVRGVAYKVLYGVYWRSVHSGTKFWGFRCEEIERGMWSEGDIAPNRVDIPICYTLDGWVVEEQSLKFLLYRDMPLFDNGLLVIGSR
jgi:hypothetical protein